MGTFRLTYLVLIISVVQFSTGLQCLFCYHNAGEESGESGDPACAAGANPGDEFLVNCTETNTFLVQPGLPKMTVADAIATGVVAPNQIYFDRCFKASVDGQLDGQNWTATGRYCLATPEELEDRCKTATREEWDQDENDDFWTETVKSLIGFFSNDTIVDSCICNQDKCNGDY